MKKQIMDLFCKQSAESAAKREYEDARRSLLECQRLRDYYSSMAEFYVKRISAFQDGAWREAQTPRHDATEVR